MHSTLIIRHNSDSNTFQVVRLRDGKPTPQSVQIPAPEAFAVESRPNSNLSRELRWYVEQFLDYPFPPVTDVAERVLDSLKAWGEQAFDTLFGDRDGGLMLADATRQGYKALTLQISGDDPRVLAWPWEVLRDPKAGVFAHICQIERRLNAQLDPLALSEKLPQDRINILLVTARPYENDVQYRSVSRLLVELIKEFPAAIHVLRPPTFDALRDHLREHADLYHILHFDGHGAYGRQGDTGSGFTFKGKEGCLVFEQEGGEAHPIRAEQLSSLLREHAVPVVVLNACQSGMIDEQAEGSFASVASSLLQAGVRSVVAMAYSLYVTGAQTFLPAFYRRLFETGSVARAARYGRQQMFTHPERICVRGKFALQDWIVPVVYQQDPVDLSFVERERPDAAAEGAAEEKPAVLLPPEIKDEENPYGFIGRDGPLLKLERAMRRKTPGILIHGLGGVGKTTLARGFVEWLHATQGLGNGCFWFAFNDIRSAEHVINRMGEALFGQNFPLASLDERLQALARAFKENPFVIIWDNFEVVRGIPGTEVTPFLSERDQNLLLKFLRQLRGAKTKVIITSRSEEDWLGVDRRKIGIAGLIGEERWLFLEEILEEMGIKVNREDSDIIELMELLNGHPLCMRVILPMLEKQSPAQVIEAVKSGMDAFEKQGAQENTRFYATLDYARKVLPENLHPLLVPLALHERFLMVDFLEKMASQLSSEWNRDLLTRFAQTLVYMGLLFDRGNGIYELHPALTGYLRAAALPGATEGERDAWSRAFVDVMGKLADELAPRQLHEQRGPFHLFGASFYFAMNLARQMEMDSSFRAILQSLAAFAQNTLNYPEAENLFKQLADAHQQKGTPEGEAAAYHQLGRIAEEQRDFETAEKWYRKSLAIEEKQGNEHGAASSYHQLGMIAQKQRDFETAEKWYRKSLAIKEKQGNEHGAASSYHQLGRIAEEQRDFETAEKWYRKSLAIKEKQGNEHGAALTYHQLGRIAEEQRDFETAEKWYRKSLAIKEKQGNEHGAAISYHQLGMIAQEQRDFETAEKWYRKSLAIFEKQGNEHGAASSYHQLGRIAEEQRNFETAEKWYRKSLAIEEKQGNEHGAASSYHQLGMIAQEQRDFETAEKWYRKSLAIFEKQGNGHGAASSYGQLGILAGLQENYEESGKWLIKCIQIFAKYNDYHAVQRNSSNYLIFYKQADVDTQKKLKTMWQDAGLPDLPED